MTDSKLKEELAQIKDSTKVRVTRVVVYEGDAVWVRETIKDSLDGRHTFGHEQSITVTADGIEVLS